MTAREPRGNDDQQQEELLKLLKETLQVKYRLTLHRVQGSNLLRKLDSIQSEIEELKKPL